MGSLDLVRLAQKAADIRENVSVLTEYARRPDAEFLDNPEAVRSARYSFIVVIEAAVNVAAHICARILSRAPSSQRESFMLLAQAGLLSETLALNLSKMAGFRNLLVHGYGEVDNAVMLAFMRHNLEDVEDFLSCVQQLAGESV
jgi:uncharacterized protein YutE (UPF0331/DUF86 family)